MIFAGWPGSQLRIPMMAGRQPPNTIDNLLQIRQLILVDVW
jgi:hypothetical protein